MPEALIMLVMLFSEMYLPTAANQLATEVTHSEGECPLWANEQSSSGENSAVKCVRGKSGEYHLALLPCYCLTQYSNSSTAVAGLCPYTCSETFSTQFIPLPPSIVNASDLAPLVCGNFSRTGQMCGECISDHAPAVYAYTLDCVNCTEYRLNWLKYVAVAFGPQTIFFVVAFLGRLSVTSGQMVGYVTISQLLATSVETHFKAVEFQGVIHNATWKSLTTIYGIWNLDFFRALYCPFCLHPDLPQLAVFALEYAVALYLMFVVLVAYGLLRLCDRFRRPFCCWSRIYHVTHRLYQACKIRNSVVDVFLMMLIISYVKILNTSFELLIHAQLKDQDNDIRETVVYFSGGLKYFGKQHWPYAVLAIAMSTVFNLLPLIVLTVYPCKCLNRFWRGSSVHNVMSDFYGSYKVTPIDLRWFGAAFLYLRLINLLLLEVDLSPMYFSWVAILYLCMAVLIGVVRPFKNQLYNVVNTCLFALIAVLKILEHTLQFSALLYYGEKYVSKFYTFLVVLYFIPPLYGLLVLLYHITPKRWLARLLQKFSSGIAGLRNRGASTSFFEESFAHRLSHADEYSALLSMNT